MILIFTDHKKLFHILFSFLGQDMPVSSQGTAIFWEETTSPRFTSGRRLMAVGRIKVFK